MLGLVAQLCKYILQIEARVDFDIFLPLLHIEFPVPRLRAGEVDQFELDAPRHPRTIMLVSISSWKTKCERLERRLVLQTAVARFFGAIEKLLYLLGVGGGLHGQVRHIYRLGRVGFLHVQALSGPYREFTFFRQANDAKLVPWLNVFLGL